MVLVGVPQRSHGFAMGYRPVSGLLSGFLLYATEYLLGMDFRLALEADKQSMDGLMLGLPG